jgi:hypothetical protein
MEEALGSIFDEKEGMMRDEKANIVLKYIPVTNLDKN